MIKDKPLNFVLIGRSGSGKGTQAKFLMEHFGNLAYISTGDLLRNLAEIDTAVGQRIQKVLAAGGLPSDDLAITLWMYEISYRVKENEGILADGFPRRLDEAIALDKFLNFLEREGNTFYLLIDVSREEAFNRLLKRRICKNCGKVIPWVGEYKNLVVCDKCGSELMNRPDDTSEAINNRMDYYDNTVTEVVKYYENRDNFIRINGEQSIEDVFEDILKALGPKLQ